MNPRPARGGRRPGNPDTRSDVLAAARELFAKQGFAATSVRAIATEAGVDPAMVHHHFGSKRDLFLATVQVPFDPAVVLAQLLHDGPDRIGERLVTRSLQVWDPANGGGPLGLLRTAITDESFRPLLRELLLTQVIAPVLDHVGAPPDERERRGALVASQLVGLGIARYVLDLPGLGEEAPLVATVGQTVQRYLTAPLPT